MGQDVYIKFPENEREIIGPIDKKLTIGSEVGEVLLEDDSISPRHCTFIVNQGVVSLVDHGSVEGTFLNRKKLEPARTFIVSEQDKIKIGKVMAKLELQGSKFDENMLDLPPLEGLISQESEESIEAPEPQGLELETQSVGVSQLLNVERDKIKPPSVEDRTNIATVDVERVELDPEVLDILKSKTGLFLRRTERSPRRRQQSSEKATDKKKTSLKYYELSTHIVFRFFALFFETVLCLSLVNIFYVYVDFKNFFMGLSESYLLQIYDPYIMNTWAMLQEGLPFIKGPIQDIAGHRNFEFALSAIILIMGLRLISTLVFGVSFGALILGVKSLGEGAFKRIAGFIRECIGLVTGPFFIFDLPTYFSKRSLKEVMTGTQLYNESKVSSIFLTVLFFPLVTLFYCFGPMFRGMEVLAPIKVEEQVVKNVEWQYDKIRYSHVLAMAYDSHDHFLTLPSFRVEVRSRKRYLTFGLAFVDLKKSKTFEVRKLKEFNMNSFYKGFSKENFLSQYFWPHIYLAANNVANEHKNFLAKKELSEALVAETQKVLRSAYTLDVKRISEFIIENGPLMAGHRDFREKFDSLFKVTPYKIILAGFANQVGVVGHHRQADQTYFSFIPLKNFQNKLYTLNIDPLAAEHHLQLGHFKIYDETPDIDVDPISKLIEGFKSDPAFEDFELSQFLYERYFMLAKWCLDKRDMNIKSFLAKNISVMISVLSENKDKNKKLYLNLNELLNALEKEHKEFFNVQTTRTI